MKEILKMIANMEMVYRNTKMEKNILEILILIRDKGLVHKFIKIKKNMLVIGRMIKDLDRVLTLTWMALFMKEIG